MRRACSELNVIISRPNDEFEQNSRITTRRRNGFFGGCATADGGEKIRERLKTHRRQPHIFPETKRLILVHIKITRLS